MYYFKRRNLSFILAVLIVFFILCLPNSIKTAFAFDFFGISLVILSIIFIPLFLWSIHSVRLNKLNLFCSAFVVFTLFTSIVAENYILSRFFIGIQFIYPFIFLSTIKLDDDKIAILRDFSMITFFFISFQVILASLGIMKFNSVNNTLIGEYERVATTAGAATFTAPVLLVLYAILNLIVKSFKIRVALLLLLFVSVFLTGTRSALIILVIASLLTALIVFSFKYQMLITFTLLVLFPVLNQRFKIMETIEKRNQNAMDYSKGDITSGREERWMVVFDKIKSNPEILLTGIGGGNTPYFNRFKDTEINIVASPHNAYLSFLFEHGIVGLLMFLLILYQLVRSLWPFYNISMFIFLFIIVVNFNTELIIRGASFSALFFMLYFVLKYKRNELKKM